MSEKTPIKVSVDEDLWIKVNCRARLAEHCLVLLGKLHAVEEIKKIAASACIEDEEIEISFLEEIIK